MLILDIEYYNMHCLIRFGKKNLKCIKPMLKICPFPFSEIYLFYIIEESIIILMFNKIANYLYWNKDLNVLNKTYFGF